MDLLERSGLSHRHPWELARFHVVEDLADHHIKEYKDKKILDLGCGDLYFLKKFAEDKPFSEFFAVDKRLDEEMLSGESGKINCYNTLEQLPSGIGAFDLILMMDLLEHVEDDSLYLKNLLQAPFVDENTLFVITVPAYETLFGEHDRFLGHFRRYTNSSLEKVTFGAGLRTIRKGYFFFSLLLPRFLEIVWEKINGRWVREGTGLTGWDQSKFVTGILKHLLLMDYRIHRSLKKVGIPTPGLSNYIVCKKPV